MGMLSVYFRKQAALQRVFLRRMVVCPVYGWPLIRFTRDPLEPPPRW